MATRKITSWDEFLLENNKVVKVTAPDAECPVCHHHLDAFGVCPNVSAQEVAIGLKFCEAA